MDAASSEPRIEIIRPGRWLYLNSPDGFERVRVELPIANLSSKLNGLRILHLTDLHLRPHWWPAYDELHQITRENPPDLILCTGDFVEHTWRRRRTLPVLQRLIDGLTSRLGVWGIIGNHDGDFLMPLIVNLRLHILNRARTLIEANGDAIELIGVPGVHRLDLDDEFMRSLPPRDPGRLRIVMQHYPDQIRRTQNLDADLVLAGHTHGGQICLPGGRPIITHDSLPKRFASGIHRFGKSWMIVGRGLGFATLKVRAFCAPQVIEVVLKRSDD